MKKKHVKITVCVSLIIIILLFAGIFIVSRQGSNEKVKLGDATFPVVTMEAFNNPINTLYGYSDEMEIPYVRDTITPVTNGKLNITVGTTDLEELKVKFEIVSLDGETVIGEGYGDALQNGKYSLNLVGAVPSNADGREAVLKLTLIQGEEKIYYYTRIVSDSERNVDKCIDFAKEFNKNTFDKENKEEIVKYLEPDYDRSNNSFQHVDIHSNVYHVTWGNMEPQIHSDILWSIKEINSVYTSLVAEYQVTVNDEKKGTELFNIKEYYRVRFLKDKMYLLNFDRTMEQVFDPSTKAITDDGIIIGTASGDLEYKSSKDGRYTAFVQERTLWLYDKKDEVLTCVFGFSDRKDEDIRNRNAQHKIRISDIDNNGNIVFVVSGYMNRGSNEGSTGASVCYYKYKENIVEEKAFMKDTKSGYLASEHLGQMIYYSPEIDTIYYVVNNNLYSLKGDRKKPEILLENIPDMEFYSNEDGNLFVCKTPNEEDSLNVYDFDKAESYKINSPEGEIIKPFGFIKNDIIYGLSDTKEKVITDTEEDILPVDKMVIRDQKNKVVKEYSSEGMIITGVSVKDNLITISRALKNGDTYVQEKDDYISNNEDNKSSTVKVDTFYSELKETQVFLNFKDGLEKTNPKVRYPEFKADKKEILSFEEDKTSEKEYYVYGKGLPPEKYTNPSDAILRAGELAGIVVDENQKYIWEKGNRDLAFFNTVKEFTPEEGKTDFEICEDVLEVFPGTKVRLNGIEFSDLCYVINTGTPAIAKIGEDEYILVTGYNLDNVEYLYPKDGKLYYEPVKTMEKKFKDNGNIFIVNL